MKKCGYCGRENNTTAKICVYCGNAIGTDEKLDAHLRRNRQLVDDLKIVRKLRTGGIEISKKQIKKFLLIVIPLVIIAAIINASGEDNEEQYVDDPTQEEFYASEDFDMAAEYILPDSNSRYLSQTEIEGLSAEQLRIARNEIYARHGRLFNDAGLQAYFNSKSWYVGSIAPDAFSESMLNEYEVANRDLIVSYEATRGY